MAAGWIPPFTVVAIVFVVRSSISTDVPKGLKSLLPKFVMSAVKPSGLTTIANGPENPGTKGPMVNTVLFIVQGRSPLQSMPITFFILEMEWTFL